MSHVELFDRDRLRPRRRWPLAPQALPALAVLAGALAWGAISQHELKSVRAEVQSTRAQLAQLQVAETTRAGESGTAARLALTQRAERLEAELAALDPVPRQAASQPLPSGWMARLETLAAPQTSLTRVEIDRSGAARVEGVAVDAQAVSRFVSAWSSQDAMAALPPRALDVQQTPRNGAGGSPAAAPSGPDAAGAAPLLKFVIRAAAWNDGAAAPAIPTAIAPTAMVAMPKGAQP